MTREDFIKKVGADIVDRYRVVNHNAFEHGCDLGAMRYTTNMPAKSSVDVGKFNAFPKDTELCQAGSGPRASVWLRT
jgi:nickel-dependent lactate racemase